MDPTSRRLFVSSTRSVNVTDHYIVSNVGGTFTGTASSSFQLSSTGTASGTTDVSNTGTGWSSIIDGVSSQTDPRTVSFSGEWLVSGAASSYDVYATWTPGIALSPLQVGSSATGTWLNLGTTQSWGLKSTNNDQQGILNITIALASNHAVILATADVELETLAAGLN